MNPEDVELVEGYLRNLAPPVVWIDWLFRHKDTPAGAGLAAALFDGQATRDLTAPAVRADVLQCVLAHPPLFAHVLAEARKAEEQLAEQLLQAVNEPPRPAATASIPHCKCGLRAGQVIVLKKDLPICNSNEVEVGRHQAGERWTVLGPEFEDGIVWLRRPDGNPHTWTDDATIFEYFLAIE
jgi:hypothetical protein